MSYLYYLIHALVVVGLGYWWWRQEPASRLKKFFVPAFVLKIVAGLMVGVFYQLYFRGGDAQLFQSQADLVTEYARVSPGSYLRLLLTRHYESETLRTSMIYVWYSNSYFMVMVLSFLNFFTNHNFYLNGLYFSIFCFWGLWQFNRVLYQLSPRFMLPGVMAFLFFPSVVFWSSGIAKEAIYLGSLGWLLAAGLRLTHGFATHPWRQVGALTLAAYLLWKIKFYFAALVFALLLGYGLVIFLTQRYTFFKNIRLKIILFLFLTVVAGLIISGWSEVFNPDYFAAQVIKSHQVIMAKSAGKPVIYFPELKPTFYSLLQHSPAAIYQVLFRPYIGEGNTVFYTVAGLENLILLVLVMLALVKVVQNKFLPFNLGAGALVLYILTLALLIGLSTPNLGSVNRYRVAFLPFLLFLLLQVIFSRTNPEKIKN